jgi:hypothetical protein
MNLVPVLEWRQLRKKISGSLKEAPPSYIFFSLVSTSRLAGLGMKKSCMW